MELLHGRGDLPAVEEVGGCSEVSLLEVRRFLQEEEEGGDEEEEGEEEGGGGWTRRRRGRRRAQPCGGPDCVYLPD